MDGGPDPMEEQLRRIRAEKQAKYEAEMAQQRREDTPPPSENKVRNVLLWSNFLGTTDSSTAASCFRWVHLDSY
jgi:hypothetical protein